MPPIDVMLVEEPYSRGPGGAKGVGELPMDVPAPAVAAAIHHATGAWFTPVCRSCPSASRSAVHVGPLMAGTRR